MSPVPPSAWPAWSASCALVLLAACGEPPERTGLGARSDGGPGGDAAFAGETCDGAVAASGSCDGPHGPSEDAGCASSCDNPAADGGSDGATSMDAAVRDAESEAGAQDGSAGGDAATTGRDDLLAPSQGALFGLYYGDESIAATSAKLGRTPPLHLTYYDFTHDWTGSVTRADLAEGRIPFVNWEVFDTPLDAILDGSHDDMLAERAADASSLGGAFFIDFGAEMNGDWSPWGGAQNGQSPEKYLAAYRYVHDALSSVSNAIWVWCPNVTDEPGQAWNQAMGYYPGDAYVDWVCVDGYNWGADGGGGWQSFRSVFQDIYPTLAATNKPMMIGEMASAEVGGDKASWIADIVPTLQTEFPRIKGLIWFDIDKERDWRISSSPQAEAALREMVSDPYFNP